MTTDAESDSGSSNSRLEQAERQIRILRRSLVVLALGLVATLLALFIPEARLVLGAALWIVAILFAVAFIAGVMWFLLVWIDRRRRRMPHRSTLDLARSQVRLTTG